MKVNWPERIWVNSPVRLFVQRQETLFFKKLRGMESDASCLEIGCGRGAAVELIIKAFGPRLIHASDIDPEMIRMAVLKQAPRRRGRVLHLVADAQHLPYPDQCMDAVFNYGIIHHLENWRLGISELSRVLKKGGGFYFEEIYPPLYANFLFRHIVAHPKENRFHSSEYLSALKDSGLRLLPQYKESRFGIVGVAVKEEGFDPKVITISLDRTGRF
jgi:ubiquinone/menaquinone biosynthesis C-methylase UbiE